MKYRIKMRVATVLMSMLLSIFILNISCSTSTQTLAIEGCIDPYSNTNITGNYIGSWQGSGMNDTGISQWGNDDNNYYKESLSVEVLTSVWRNQDMDNGRDAYEDLCKIGAGSSGLDYTKLDLEGNKLHDSARNWACVLDNHTGLIWYNKAYPVYQQYATPTKYQVVQSLYGPGPGGYQTVTSKGGNAVQQNSGYSYAVDTDSSVIGGYYVSESDTNATTTAKEGSILYRYRTNERILLNSDGTLKTTYYELEDASTTPRNGNCGLQGSNTVKKWDVPTVNQLLSLRVLDNIHAVDWNYFPAYQVIYEPIDPYIYVPTNITNYTEDYNTRCKAALQSKNITGTHDNTMISEEILNNVDDTSFAYCRRVIKRIAWTNELCKINNTADQYWVMDLYTGGLACKAKLSKVELFADDQSGWRMIYQLVAMPTQAHLESIWNADTLHDIYN